MLVKTLSTEVINFKINEISIPDKDIRLNSQVNSVSDDFWLNPCVTPCSGVYASGDDNLSIKGTIVTDVKGVRPLISFESDEVKIGDELIIGNHLFTVIDNEHAICKTIIGFSQYHNKTECHDFKSSELNNFLIQWLIRSSSVVLKVISTTGFLIPLNIVNTDVPSYELLMKVDITSRANGMLYWTKSRKDEFSAIVITQNGYTASNSISQSLVKENKYCNVCPLMTFNTKSIDSIKNFGLKEGVIFAVNDRIYRMITDQHALCLNTIGISCYSSAICEMGTANDEINFYAVSELNEFINKWRKTLYDN